MVDDVLERLEERVVELAPSELDLDICNETVSARDSESSISKEGRTRVT